MLSYNAKVSNKKKIEFDALEKEGLGSLAMKEKNKWMR